MYFYAIHSGSEMDLYLPGRNLGIEIKRLDVLKVTRSMSIACEDLKVEKLWVVYPGTKRFNLDDRIEAVPLNSLLEKI